MSVLGFDPVQAEYKSSVFSISNVTSKKDFLLFFIFVRKNSGRYIIFLYFCAIFNVEMKKIPIIMALALLVLSACNRKADDGIVLHRSFYNDTWERFDFVHDTLEIKQEKSFDLSMEISFTEAYAFDDFSMVFTVFDAYGNPYRSRGYKFKLKDKEGNWNSQQVDGCYAFTLPINKDFRITDPGKYCFQIEYRMPKTPIMGVRELTLYNENN